MFTSAYWDKLYETEVYLFGKEPNQYLKEKLDSVSTGRILFPAEGEGRNAVYAAQKGWEVTAFDLSEISRQKALALAKNTSGSIQYIVGSVEEIDIPLDSFDVLALIFAHFDPHKRSVYHHRLSQYLKKGGTLILQGFGNGNSIESEHSSNTNDLYYDLKQLQEDFSDFEIIEARESKVKMNEGVVLKGESVIISLLAIKK